MIIDINEFDWDFYNKCRQKIKDVLSEEFVISNENLTYVKSFNYSGHSFRETGGRFMFFDNSSLPPSCNSYDDLSCKNVLYGIFCNNKIYIGQTSDFGERMSTHLKDSRKSKSHQLLYSDINLTKKCISFVLGLFDDKETLKKAENLIIKTVKEYSVLKNYNFDIEKFNFIRSTNEFFKECSSIYCYNIKD